MSFEETSRLDERLQTPPDEKPKLKQNYFILFVHLLDLGWPKVEFVLSQ